MKGKTFHITIQTETAAGCLDALRVVAEIDISQRSVTQCVALALEGFVGTMKASGQIPRREAEEAERLLALQDAPSVPPSPPRFDGADLSLATLRGETPRPPGREAVAFDQVHASLETRLNEGSTIDVEVNEEPSEPTTSQATANRDVLLAGERHSLEEITNAAREDDELVKRATHEGGDFQLALEFVYSKIPPSLWGTERALELITRVVDEVDPEAKTVPTSNEKNP